MPPQRSSSLAPPDQVSRVERIEAALEQHQASYEHHRKHNRARETRKFYASRRWRAWDEIEPFFVPYSLR